MALTSLEDLTFRAFLVALSSGRARLFRSDKVPVMRNSPPIVLTIAGFDPSSGAGITADIKTIAAHGCYGVSAITALTVQSTAGVRRVAGVDPELLRDSLAELAGDVKVSAVHVGMIGTGKVAAIVADFLQTSQLSNVVVDPILTSSSGAALLDSEGIDVLVKRLLPMADVVTPNMDEAATLAGMAVKNADQMKRAAVRLHEFQAKAVVVTGGNLECAVDVLSFPGKDAKTFRAAHLDSPNTHGTGCAFSTAIACQLAIGRGLEVAVLLSKAYVLEAIRNGYSIGKGAGPVNHMF